MDSSVTIRLARSDDEPILFAWRNLPWVVELGASRRTVSLAEHHAWFAETLMGKDRCLFMILNNSKSMGMLRYDYLSQSVAEISLYLMPEAIGHGAGSNAFQQSIPRLLSLRSVSTILAKVLRSNSRSLNFFHRQGFTEDAQRSSSGLIALARELQVIPHSRPSIGAVEARAAGAAVASGQLAQGPMVHALEERWCQLTTMPSAAGMGSGLAALRLGLLGLGVGAGDEVVVPAYSCVALPNAVLALGAKPILADVDLDRWTLSPAHVEKCLSARTKAIVAVHLFGMPAPVEALSRWGVPVIEDCAHGIGGRCGNHPFGGTGTASFTSFYATKMIAAGEGGMFAARDSDLVERARHARDYGDQLPDGHHLNDKMTDIEAAIALEQLKRLPEMLESRRQHAEYYSKNLASLAEQDLLELPQNESGRIWYRYVVRLQRHGALAASRWMKEHHICAEQPVWDLRQSEHWTERYDTTALAFERVISLPLYPDLSQLERDEVCHALNHCLEVLPLEPK